jgi:hypothetical protein
MEQAVWISISIIALIIAFGVLTQLYTQNRQNMQEQAFTNAFQTLKTQCDYVCDSSPETILPIDVDLPSGVFLYTKDYKICGRFREESACALCDCRLAAHQIELNTSAASKAFDIHAFKCYFERGEDEIKMDCQG